MRTSSPISNVVIAAISVGVLLSNAQLAAAKTKAKPTYEQAWALCTAQMDRNHILKADAGQRYAAGAACMLHHGYRI
jgi:hypothetical protein